MSTLLAGGRSLAPVSLLQMVPGMALESNVIAHVCCMFYVYVQLRAAVGGAAATRAARFCCRHACRYATRYLAPLRFF